jgi:pimeloyl-ACP methyl ester carboxylesterase
VTSPDPTTVPVVLVHGWGGSFEATWQRSGFTELLRDEGRTVVGVDLLGHGSAPKPHDPAEYADLGGRVLDAIDEAAPGGQVDAIGFSLGAMTLLRLATVHPHRFRRLVLAGVGKNVLEPDDGSGERIAAAVEGRVADDDTPALVFAQYANQPGNDAVALAAVMRRPRTPLTAAQLAGVTCPVTVIIGDADFAGPADPLVAALPRATLKVLRRTDHFATPESFDFVDAALRALSSD